MMERFDRLETDLHRAGLPLRDTVACRGFYPSGRAAAMQPPPRRGDVWAEQDSTTYGDAVLRLQEQTAGRRVRFAWDATLQEA